MRCKHQIEECSKFKTSLAISHLSSAIAQMSICLRLEFAGMQSPDDEEEVEVPRLQARLSKTTVLKCSTVLVNLQSY